MKRQKTQNKVSKLQEQEAGGRKQERWFMDEPKYRWLGAGILVILSVLIYSNAFTASWQLDDYYTIVDNVLIRSIRNVSAWWNFAQNRPVATFSFVLNYHFFQLDLVSYHVVNLLIHLMNTSLVWWLCMLIFMSPGMEGNKLKPYRHEIAFFTALLFVVHPLATASVTYIIQRTAALAALFYILSVALYLRARLIGKITPKSVILILLAGISTLLAVKTKENTFTLPFAIIVTEVFLLQKQLFKGNTKKLWVILGISLVLLAIVALPFYRTFTGIKPIMPSLGKTPVIVTPLNYLLTQFSVIVKYIQLLIFPVSQNVDYDWPMVDTMLSIRTMGSFLILMAIAGLAVYLYNKQRLISFGIFWFFITLAVESSFIPLADMIFEHRTYLPSVGFFLVISYTVFYLLANKNKALILGVFSVMVLFYSFKTYERNKIWKTGVSLWTDVIEKSPGVTRPLLNRGFAFARLEQWDNAIADYTRAIEIDSVYNYEAFSKRAIAYGNVGQWEKAINDCNKAISLEPKLVKAYYNKGVAHASLGKLEEAIADFTEVLKLDPNFEKVNYQRGALYMQLGIYDKALLDFNKEIEINPPTAEKLYNRGFVCEKLNDWIKAIENYTLAISLDPKYVSAYYNRAIAYYHIGQKENSLPDYNMAIQLTPDDKEMYYMRGLALSDLGQTEKAIADYSKALEIDPNFSMAFNNREALYRKIGRRK
jgi:tetratricopeptide (TPR) repeat protein